MAMGGKDCPVLHVTWACRLPRSTPPAGSAAAGRRRSPRRTTPPPSLRSGSTECSSAVGAVCLRKGQKHDEYTKM